MTLESTPALSEQSTDTKTVSMDNIAVVLAFARLGYNIQFEENGPVFDALTVISNYYRDLNPDGTEKESVSSYPAQVLAQVESTTKE